MEIFKSQAAIADFAYTRTNGNKEAMIELVHKLLAQNPELIKEHKRNALDNGGTKAYRAYAKVKVREYFKRHVNKTNKVTNITKTNKVTKLSLFRVDNSADIDGTSLKGHITTSYANLVKHFGQPTEGDGYKVSSEWIFTGKNGEVFTIYDWKATKLYDSNCPSINKFKALPRYEFHVGGKTDTTKFIEWLNSTLSSSHLRVV